MENIFHKIIASDKFLGDVSFTWGYSKYNQLGINTTTTRNNLNTKFLEDHTWKSISNGIHHTAAIKTDGSLWCWGLNNYGQLGTNDTESVNTPVTTFLEGKNWKSVSCGGYHTAAIKTDGSLWGWGRNNYGQLGTNDAKNVIIPAIIFLEENKWKSVSCGYYHTSAISVNK